MTTEMTPGAIATGIGFILFLTFVSWVLAHIGRRLPEGIPRWVKIMVCGTGIQIVLLVLGYLFFVEEDFLHWALSRPTRAYFLVPGALLLGCLAAWSVLRDRERGPDFGVFE